MNLRSVHQAVEPALIQKMSKLTLLVIWLVVMMYLISLLPGVDRIIPQTPVTVVASISAIVTVLIVGLLISLASKLATTVHGIVEPYEPFSEHASSVAYWAVILLAVLIAHRGFAGLVVPFLEELAWVYDSIFLILALPAVVCIGVRIYLMVEPGSQAISAKMGGNTAKGRE